MRARGHDVAAVDLPCDDRLATLHDYAAVVPAADVVVGHSLGGLTIPLVPAAHRGPRDLGGHCPMLARPAELAALLDALV